MEYADPRTLAETMRLVQNTPMPPASGIRGEAARHRFSSDFLITPPLQAFYRFQFPVDAVTQVTAMSFSGH